MCSGVISSCTSSKNNEDINNTDIHEKIITENNKEISNTDIHKKNNNVDTKNLINFKNAIRFRNKSGYYYVDSVHDGDTFTILMPLIFKSFSCYKNSSKEKLSASVNMKSSTDENNVVFYKVNIRLAGVDAYEIHPKKDCENREEHLIKGPLATTFVTNLILNKFVFLEFTKDNDPYARPIAKTFIDNKNIADMIIKKGLGVPYFGGKKTI